MNDCGLSADSGISVSSVILISVTSSINPKAFMKKSENQYSRWMS